MTSLMTSLGVRITLIVDTPDEAAARAIAAAFDARTGLEAMDHLWTPYPKMGAHGRISFVVFLAPVPDNQAVIDAIEGLCGLLVEPKALVEGYLNAFLNDDGSLVYNRIFDVRTSGFLMPDILWADIEVETNPCAQAQLRGFLKSEPR